MRKKWLMLTVMLAPAMEAESPALPYDAAARTEFRDKLGMLSVTLPAGYQVRDQSTSDRVKATLRYGNDCQVILISSVMRKPWDAPSEMEKKMSALRRGQVVGRAEEISSRLCRLDAADGYEYQVRKNDWHCLQGFAGVARGRSYVYVVEVSGRKNAAAAAQPLVEAINQSFKGLAPLPAAAAAERPRPGVPPPPPAGPADDWAAAQASIKVDGVIRSRQQVLAMISGQMAATGDTVRIVYDGRTYPFRVIGISPDSERVAVVPVK